MSILVTGANGFIGIQVCKALLQRGHRVVSLYHRRRERLNALAGHADLHIEGGDILDRAKLREICRAYRPDGVCHLAVQPPGTHDPRMARQVNVQGTQSLLDICCIEGIPRLVYTSTMSVYNFLVPSYLPVDEEHPVEPLQAYGEEKWIAEQHCLAYRRSCGMRIPVLRLAGIYGPGKRSGAVYNFTRAVLRDEVVKIEQNRRVDLLYVEDAAEAVVTSLEKAEEVEDEVLNIGAGCSVGLDELAASIGREMGKDVRIDCGEEGNEFYLDISRAREVLGFHPLPLHMGLRRFIPWVEEDIVEGK